MLGHAQSEETKKKISEALKKGGSAEPESTGLPRSKEAQGLFDDFQKSQKSVEEMKAAVSEIQDEAKELVMPEKPEGKMTKEQKTKRAEMQKKIKIQKEKVQKMVKDIQKKIKAEREKQKAIKQKAMELKNVQQAQERIAAQTKHIEAAQSNLKKADSVQQRIEGLIAKAKKPEQAARLKDSLARLDDSRKRNGEAIVTAKKNIADQQKIIKSKGRITRSVFNFEERIAWGSYCMLTEGGKKFTIWRTLTLQEKRVDFQVLNEMFDEGEDALKKDLTNLAKEDITRNMVQIKNRLKVKDISGIGDSTIISANKLETVLNKHIKKAYENGKITAANELKAAKPVTPTVKIQIMNLDSAMISERISSSVDLAVKQKIRDGIAKGVADSATLSAASGAAQETMSTAITHTIGNVVGEYMNKGRRLVFENNAANIQGFRRSEILDGRTCAMCLSIDERVVTSDDPMSQLDEVHDNCRGVWVPVMIYEEMPDTVGFPATIENSFETIGGAPTVNAFTQLKKPLNASNKAVQQEIKRRIQSSGVEESHGHVI